MQWFNKVWNTNIIELRKYTNCSKHETAANYKYCKNYILDSLDTDRVAILPGILLKIIISINF